MTQPWWLSWFVPEWAPTIPFQHNLRGCHYWDGEGFLLGRWIPNEVGWHASSCWNSRRVPHHRNPSSSVGAQGTWVEHFIFPWIFSCLVHLEHVGLHVLMLLFFLFCVPQFPFFCSDREYIIGRRIWESGRSYYCVTKVGSFDQKLPLCIVYFWIVSLCMILVLLDSLILVKFVPHG